MRNWTCRTRAYDQRCCEWSFPPSLCTLVTPPRLLIVQSSSLNDYFSSNNCCLTELDLRECRSDSAYRTDLRFIRWPCTLRKLVFGQHWRSHLSTKEWAPPARIVELHLPARDKCARNPIGKLLLPPALEVLHAGYGDLPLHSLRLPSTLRELHLALKWNLPISEMPPLPAHLDLLPFGDELNQPVALLQLPPSLRILHFGLQFDLSLHEVHQPWTTARFVSWAATALAGWEMGFDRTVEQRLVLPPGLLVFAAHRRALDGKLTDLELPPRCVVRAICAGGQMRCQT